MGKRSAVVELFLGDMGSMQRELQPSIESCEPTAEERGAGDPHATFYGSRGRPTASGDPVGEEKSSSLLRPLGAPWFVFPKPFISIKFLGNPSANGGRGKL